MKPPIALRGIVKHAGEMKYIGAGHKRLWLYVEWGDGFKLWLGPLRFSMRLRLGWQR